MKSVFLLLVLSAVSWSQAQSCVHTLTQSVAPGSNVLVYRNGVLLKPNVDYSITARNVNHAYWRAADTFSYVYERLVRYTQPGTTVSSNMYATLREEGTCVGTTPLSGLPVLAPDQIPATIQFGTGFETARMTSVPDAPLQVSVSGAFVLYRTQPPTAPGACTSGSGALSTTPGGSGDQYLFLCVQNDDNSGFRWARVGPLSSVW